ncbi:MAG: PIN domain nuclease [Deltaproteobacteria bacterium]|nr:PIN domain nuclease [Deltaproteobacteria bacterium]
MILVDTSVLIDFFKGIENESCRKFKYIQQQDISFGINSVIFQEVLQGARSDDEYYILKTHLETQRFYHPKDPIGSFARAAKIYVDCRQKGITVRSTIDCLIVQTVLEHNLFLLHNDGDFEEIAKIIPLRFY